MVGRLEEQLPFLSRYMAVWADMIKLAALENMCFKNVNVTHVIQENTKFLQGSCKLLSYTRK